MSGKNPSVINTAPVGSEFGQVVRPVGAVTVTSSMTNPVMVMIAGPVQVSGAVTSYQITAADASSTLSVFPDQWLIQSSIDCFLNWGAAATTATLPIPAKTPLVLAFPSAVVHAITAAGTGTFTAVKIS